MKSSCTLMYSFREYGCFTMETIIATAFGRYVNLQRGEADKITEDAREVLTLIQEEKALSPHAMHACLCRLCFNISLHC